MPDLDTKSLVAELGSKHGINIDEDDPAVGIVLLNRLILEKTSEQITARVRVELKDFEEAVARVERRAGHLIAEQFNEHLDAVRKSLQNDITLAGGKANEIVYRIEQVNRYPVMIRWTAIGIICSLVMFACGVVLGWGYLPK